MAGDNIIQGSQPVEWVQETTFATANDGTDVHNWFGIGTSWSVDQGVETESIRYLPEYGSSDKLEKRVNIDHREMWEGEISYHPQNFTLLQYFTGATGGTSDSLSSIQVGEVNEEGTDEFRRILGGVGEEVTLSVDEDGTWEVSGSFIFADAEAWSTTDYIDSVNGGAHASEDTSDPFAYKDLANITYGGASFTDAVESMEITISNDLAIVRDPDASTSTLISAIVPVSREITVDITFSYASFDMMSEVRSYTAKDLSFDIGSTTFTITGVQFPEAPYEFTAEDLISDSVSSDPAAGISWA